MEPQTIDLVARPIEAAAFAPYGTLLPPHEDGKLFGPDEAQLELGRGTPRFYVMRLAGRPSGFRRITRHLQVTQCLAAVGGGSWVIAVCPPDDPDSATAVPDLGRLAAFEVPGDVAIMLHRSTWHAGPYFAGPRKDFFNLELADTNQVDHHSVDLAERFGKVYRFNGVA
ncbi:MAG: ureidoglycolate lyase [Burkholderiales bacterium]|nr:ureidoglycolate lyase [Burkholderiales bacterium]